MDGSGRPSKFLQQLPLPKSAVTAMCNWVGYLTVCPCDRGDVGPDYFETRLKLVRSVAGGVTSGRRPRSSPRWRRTPCEASGTAARAGPRVTQLCSSPSSPTLASIVVRFVSVRLWMEYEFVLGYFYANGSSRQHASANLQ